MMKSRKFVLNFFMSILFIFCSFIYICQADDALQVYKTEDFIVSDEFLKVLSNPKTGNILGNGLVIDLDTNNDGIISINEVENLHLIYLDVSGCAISDWSDLEYFKNLTDLRIINADFSKCSFDVIPSSCNVRDLRIQDSTNCDSIVGLNKFPTLMNIRFENCDKLSCSVLYGIETISSLYISKTDIVDQSFLSSVKVNSITLKSDSLRIPGFTLPSIANLRKLDVSNNELDYLVGTNVLIGLDTLNASYNNISNLVTSINNVREVDLSLNNIKDIDWYVHSNTAKERIINLYGNPLSTDAIKEILEYNFDFNSIFDGKEGEEYSLDINSQSPFKWLSSDDLEFTIEDTSIISITDGVVNLLKPGLTNVDVYYSNGVEGIDYCISYNVKVWGINETPSPTPMITRRPTEIPSLVPTATPSIVPTEIPVKIGDVNRDGYIDAVDALDILKMSAKLLEVDSVLADINEDTVVNAEDALMVLKIAAKLI